MASNIESGENTSTTSSLLRDLILVIVGSVIGVVANQMFHHRNVDYETQVRFNEATFRNQIIHLNRMLIFAQSVEMEEFQCIVPKNKIAIDSTEGLFVTSDSVYYDTIDVRIPLFVSDSLDRKTMMNDMTIIRENREHVPHPIYSKFEALHHVLLQHPLPNPENLDDVIESEWTTDSVQSKWKLAKEELFTDVYQVLYGENSDFSWDGQN